MKIIRYGTVTFREGVGPQIEGWQIEREPEDPEDATMEQLLLGFAIHWAKEKFDAAMKDATTDVLRQMIQKSLEKKFPKPS